MLLSDRTSYARIVRLPVLAALGLLVLIAGCSVQPLYSSSSAPVAGGVSSDVRTRLASIAIDEVDTIYAQAVRNRLIFGLYGGAAEPVKPAYHLALGLQMTKLAAVEVDVGDKNSGRASAGTIRIRSNYVLRDDAGKVVAKGTRTVSSSYDRPRQEYANLRAERDAQQRAAEELAQFLVLSLAQDMQKLP